MATLHQAHSHPAQLLVCAFQVSATARTKAGSTAALPQPPKPRQDEVTGCSKCTSPQMPLTCAPKRLADRPAYAGRCPCHKHHLAAPPLQACRQVRRRRWQPGRCRRAGRCLPLLRILLLPLLLLLSRCWRRRRAYRCLLVGRRPWSRCRRRRPSAAAAKGAGVCCATVGGRHRGGFGGVVLIDVILPCSLLALRPPARADATEFSETPPPSAACAPPPFHAASRPGNETRQPSQPGTMQPDQTRWPAHRTSSSRMTFSGTCPGSASKPCAGRRSVRQWQCCGSRCMRRCSQLRPSSMLLSLLHPAASPHACAGSAVPLRSAPRCAPAAATCRPGRR